MDESLTVAREGLNCDSAASIDAGLGMRSLLPSCTCIMDVMPLEALTGWGDFNARSLLGLTTMGPGRFFVLSRLLAFRSNILTNEFVGAIEVASVGSSLPSLSACRLYSDSRLGFGGAAGFRVLEGEGRMVLALESGRSRDGARAAATDAAWREGDLE